ncbi:MAG TPA: sigma factor-like helix-turn-helix DNA-binding protein [Solirubrobacterales bacterium]|jgi:hypothetical protein
MEAQPKSDVEVAGSDIAVAGARLPERQRQALELREQEGLSYEEIAARLGTSWSSVAKLIAHARITVYDELHGTILASVAPSAECERALPLIAAREDGELDGRSAEATWVDDHLEECGRCRRGVEEMSAARAACRGQGSSGARPSRRGAALAVGLAALLLFAGGAVAMRAGGGSSATPADSAAAAGGRSKTESAAQSPGNGPTKGAAAERKGAHQEKAAARSNEETDAGEATAAPVSTPVSVPAEAGGHDAGGPDSRPIREPGRGDVEAPRPTSAAKDVPKPAPTRSTPAPAPAPSTAPTPLAEEPAPVEEPTDEPPRGREPPGKPEGKGEGKPPH